MLVAIFFCIFAELNQKMIAKLVNFVPFTLHLRDRDLVINHPLIMGILNATPDSFYAASRSFTTSAMEARVEQMVSEGADIIDIGAYSTRPGADEVDADEELRRLQRGIEVVKRIAPHLPISIDTFRASVARTCIAELGAQIINDVSGGTLDEDMLSTAGELNVPYILMHMRGTPATMQQFTQYDGGVVHDVVADLKAKMERFEQAGCRQIIIDPGFGFSKTMEQNYELMSGLSAFGTLNAPLLVGISRKSMIYRLLHTTPAEALTGTTVLHTVALLQGCHILRVHDVKAAVEVRTIVHQLQYPNK